MYCLKEDNYFFNPVKKALEEEDVKAKNKMYDPRKPGKKEGPSNDTFDSIEFRKQNQDTARDLLLEREEHQRVMDR